MKRKILWGLCAVLLLFEAGLSLLLWRATRPFVSVVMPIYNREELLDAAVSSVLHQDWADFELLLLDDGSSDGSWEKMQQYAKKDKRIRLLRNKTNRGISFSRNRLLEAARGRYVAILDSDDTALPFWLTKSLHVLRSDSTLKIVYPVSFVFDENKPGWEAVMPRFPVIDILSDNIFSNVGVVFERDFVMRHDIRYDEAIKASEDYDFWAKCVMQGAKAKRIATPLVRVRIHRSNSPSYYREMVKTRREVARRLRLHFGVSPMNLDDKCAMFQEISAYNRLFPYFDPQEVAERIAEHCNPKKE